MKHRKDILKKQLLLYEELASGRKDFIEKSLLFMDYLLEYNQKVNLISRKDEENIVVNQWLHSVAAFSELEEAGGDVMLDFGSGGGFPGILLALYFLDKRIVLVESIGKKARFLSSVSEYLGLSNVRIFNERVEDLPLDHRDLYPVVTARAVASLKNLVAWGLPLVKPGGFLLTWKKFDTKEFEELKRNVLKYIKLSILTPKNDFGSERLRQTRFVKVFK